MRPVARAREHVGEWQITVWADTPEELFAEAARAVARQCGPVKGEPGPWEHIELSARDQATLLVDWLNELLALSEIEGRAYAYMQALTVRDGALTAEVRGRKVSRWQSPVKAATYHGLSLERQGSRWKAVVLLDV